MHPCESPESLFTPPMLDALLARWKALPGHSSGHSHANAAERVTQARAILSLTVESQLPHMSPGDQALFARLLAAREAQAWRTHFFDCFDLMARTRGAAIAVLRLHDLYRLLCDGKPAAAQDIPAELELARA